MVDRAQVVAETRTWLHTPYELNQMCKGGGVDCARIIYAVLRDCGLMPLEYIERFGADWCINAKDETYVYRMLRHATSVLEGISYPSLKVLPGNIALVRIVGSKVYSHGGIVTAWPLVIHAAPDEVEEVDASTHWLWAHREIKIFDPWIKPDAAIEAT